MDPGFNTTVVKPLLKHFSMPNPNESDQKNVRISKAYSRNWSHYIVLSAVQPTNDSDILNILSKNQSSFSIIYLDSWCLSYRHAASYFQLVEWWLYIYSFEVQDHENRRIKCSTQKLPQPIYLTSVRPKQKRNDQAFIV